jgi:rabenosyn-5
MPKFQKLLSALQNPESPPTSNQISDASRTRKRLMDSFQQYDTAARRIRDMPSPSPTQLKLQKAIYTNATQFLHLHMLPLKALPKVLKHATPHGSSMSQQGGRPELQGSRSSLALLNGPGGTHIRQNSSSAVSISSVNSARISELETEEKALRERLIVLEEQKFLVSEMMADAQRRRKFDEVEALRGNVEDLGREVDEVTRLLDGVRGEFEGAYLGSGVSTPVRRGSEMTIGDKGKMIDNG